mmetsp:Transcript_7951/g.16411  ORF Transcript_7951/g.16411 Transcript_7951/m.16411 type:complete len:89 (-) Transcript_7951:158-424(-)
MEAILLLRGRSALVASSLTTARVPLQVVVAEVLLAVVRSSCYPPPAARDVLLYRTAPRRTLSRTSASTPRSPWHPARANHRRSSSKPC